MADGVDAAVHAMQAPVADTAPDRLVVESDREQLRGRHDAVLRACERRALDVPQKGRPSKLTLCGGFSVHPLILAPRPHTEQDRIVTALRKTCAETA